MGKSVIHSHKPALITIHSYLSLAELTLQRTAEDIAEVHTGAPSDFLPGMLLMWKEMQSKEQTAVAMNYLEKKSLQIVQSAAAVQPWYCSEIAQLDRSLPHISHCFSYIFFTNL